MLVIGSVVLHRLREPSPYETGLFAGAHGMPDRPETAVLAQRYLGRARRYRFVGSAAGAMLGFALVIDLHQSLDIFFVLAGWLAGIVACELFRLRRRSWEPTDGSRTASIEPRSAVRYAGPRLVLHTRVAGLLCVACAVLGAAGARSGLSWDHPGAGARFLVEGGFAVVVLVVVEASQRAVASRSRPALPPHVLKADDAIRRVGAQSLGYGGSGLLVMVLATEVVGLGQPIASFLLWVWAMALAVTERQLFWPPVRRRLAVRRHVHRVASPR
jgi:hypothetical protein